MKLLFFILGLFIGGIRRRTLMREGKRYLIRTTLFSCPLFSLKIHKALMSDPATPHDHPWNYLSLILWGGYYEATLRENNGDAPGKFEERKWYGPGSLLYRRGDRFHKLIIPEGKYSVSLILTFRK